MAHTSVVIEITVGRAGPLNKIRFGELGSVDYLYEYHGKRLMPAVDVEAVACFVSLR